MLIQMISLPACVPLCLFYGVEVVRVDKDLDANGGFHLCQIL